MRTALLFISVVVCSQATDIPRTLVSEEESDPIHSAIIRKEAWTLDPVRRLRADAEKRLKEGPWTVTAERPKDVDIDPHDYYSEALYWWPNPELPGAPYIRREGQVNPARFTANKTALSAMADAVFSLGAAAYFLDEPRYAQRAARDIQTWFINPKTRMNPNLEYAQAIRGIDTGRAAGILDGRVFIRITQGMEFLSHTGLWDPKDQLAVHKWFDEYLHWLTHSKNGEDEKHADNNHASWWTAQVAAVATFVENRPAQQSAFDYYRDRIFARQTKPEAGVSRDEWRTVEAYANICRIAQVQGVDLWSARARNAATLGSLIDSFEPYLTDPRKWSKEQVSDLPSDSLYALAFAGMGLKKPEYVALFRKLEHSEAAWPTLVDLIVARWENSAHQTRH